MNPVNTLLTCLKNYGLSFTGTKNIAVSFNVNDKHSPYTADCPSALIRGWNTRNIPTYCTVVFINQSTNKMQISYNEELLVLGSI